MVMYRAVSRLNRPAVEAAPPDPPAPVPPDPPDPPARGVCVELVFAGGRRMTATFPEAPPPGEPMPLQVVIEWPSGARQVVRPPQPRVVRRRRNDDAWPEVRPGRGPVLAHVVTLAQLRDEVGDSLGGAPPDDVLGALAALRGRPVVARGVSSKARHADAVVLWVLRDAGVDVCLGAGYALVPPRAGKPLHAALWMLSVVFAPPKAMPRLPLRGAPVYRVFVEDPAAARDAPAFRTLEALLLGTALEPVVTGRGEVPAEPLPPRAGEVIARLCPPGA